MSNAGVKFNSNCIIVVVLVVNNIYELSRFLFDGAKLLYQTAKTCQCKEKNTKKCTFLIESAFFSKIYRFLIVYPSLSASIFFLQYI